MVNVGIYTFHRAHNYGAVLQAYALQTVLNSLSPEVNARIVDHHCYAIETTYRPLYLPDHLSLPLAVVRMLLYMPKQIMRRKMYDDFLQQHFLLAEKEAHQNILITGSDQVWNPTLTGQDSAYFLELPAQDRAMKFSYAASFGQLSEYVENKEYVLGILNNFDGVSLREQRAVDTLAVDLSIPPRMDLDPTLLLPHYYWDRLCRNILPQKKPFILLYTAQRPKNIARFARALAKQTGIPIYSLRFRGKSPQQFLALFRDASYVVTTSFHGTIFSIQFQRSFFVELEGKDCYNERVENLLQLTGLMDRARNNTELGDYTAPIDWEMVDRRLEEKRADSLAYLRSIIDSAHTDRK